MLSDRCLSVCQSVCLVLSVCDVGVLWPNGWMYQDETWRTGSPWLWPHCVKWGPQRGTIPQFLAHICCGQTAGWIKMAHETKVGLCPGHIVQDGDPAPPPQKMRAEPPLNFWPMSFVAKQLDGSRYHLYGGRPRPRPHCVRWGPAPPPKNGHAQPPTFRPMFIVAKRLDGSRCHLVRR